MKLPLTITIILLLSSGYAKQQFTNINEIKNVFLNLYGGTVEDARAVTTNSGDVFLLGNWSPYEDGDPQLRLLRSFAGSFIEVWAKEDSYLYQLEDIDLSDLNQDGFPEVYWKTNIFGNAIGDVTFVLYDTQTDYELEAMLSYTHGIKSNDVRIDPAFGDDLTFLNFIEAKIADDEHFALADTNSPDPEDPQNANTVWRAKYGGFSDHSVNQVDIVPYYYTVKDKSIVNHSSKIEFSHRGLRFVGVFKDSVYAVDDKNKKYFVVFSPDTTYDWVADISPLGPCVAFTTSSYDNDVAYYNVETQELSWSPEVACRY